MSEFFPENIPVKCQNCPGLKSTIGLWQTLQELSDHVLESSFSLTTEELADRMPVPLIEVIGMLDGIEFDSESETDRLEAAKLMEANSGQAYLALNEVIGSVEQSMQRDIYLCQGKGPIKMRVHPDDNTSVLLTVCRADLKDAHDDHTHDINATVQREQ